MRSLRETLCPTGRTTCNGRITSARANKYSTHKWVRDHTLVYNSLRVSVPKMDRVHGFGNSTEAHERTRISETMWGLSSMLTAALAFPD